MSAEPAPARPELRIAPSVPAVELRDITREFGTEPRVYALRDVNLVLEHGESLAIVGPSGSGKSTLLNVLGCLDRPTSGTYLLDGIDVSGLDERRRAMLRAQAIGFVFQTFNLLAHRSVLDNVMLAEVYRGASRHGRAQRAMAALQRVGMEDRASFVPTRLSGGEQQRVAIARALMADHSMLLCDEPTGNLDRVSAENVASVLLDLHHREKTMLIIVTHSAQLADRCPVRYELVARGLKRVGAFA
jgi:ABC-type lipoprotein export system ATPase subunit